MHNPLPHNRIFIDIDKMVNNEMYNISNHIIVLGLSAKEIIIKNQNIKTPISVLNTYHLRNFTGKNRIKRVRREIGLPTNAIIFGNIDSIKPYK
jgi:hypothetical protein